MNNVCRDKDNLEDNFTLFIKIKISIKIKTNMKLHNSRVSCLHTRQIVNKMNCETQSPSICLL